MSVVRLNNASLIISGRKLLDDIALNIDNGLTVLAGRNGAGKSSLLKTLAGVWDISSGEHYLGGENWRELNAGRRANLVSYLPQDAAYAWPVAVKELSVSGFGVEELANKRVDEISGGELQRVMLANAMQRGGRMLILDEPLSSQDPAWQIRIMETLKQISRCRAVIVALHDIRMASLYADEVIWLEGGKIAGFGMSVNMVRKIFSVEPLVIEKDGKECIIA